MTNRLKFGEIEPGLSYSTPGIVITEAQIVNFAGVSGDFFDVHMDDEYAKSVGFPGRVAHGLLCLSVVDGLKNRSPVQFDGIASLEWSYKFLAAVVPGDRIRADIRVIELRPTRDGRRGIVRLQLEVLNQRDEVVQRGENVLMVRA